VRLAWQSYTLHDISTGSDATPLWIPQLAMAAGAVVFAIAFIDLLVLELSGKRVAVPKTEEPAHVE
jgi:TRAP-type C4-dicarboxylate transport system permease small subunit